MYILYMEYTNYVILTLINVWSNIALITITWFIYFTKEKMDVIFLALTLLFILINLSSITYLINIKFFYGS